MSPAARTLVLVALAALLAGCAGGAALNPVEPTIRLAVDDATAPLAESLLNSYETLHPGALLSLIPTSREGALHAVETGRADAALVLHPVEGEALFHTPIAQEMLVLVGHPDLPVDGLNRVDARAIFTGQVRGWPAPDGLPPQRIEVVVPEAGTSTRLAFDTLVLSGAPVTGSARVAASGEHAAQIVAQTPGAVGIASGEAQPPDIKPLAYEDVEPTRENARNNTYRLVTSVEFVAGADPQGALRSFLDWVLSEDGQSVVRRHMLAVNE
ncbi:MAG TPA: substrate-binding domain-containing protein [Aggregatilineales bacterium]|nr:substrate-binding domain-containing protein [Aggregatilineales bacterium]